MRKELYFRVDGNHEIGYGHLIRCIALAELVQSDFDIYFVSIDADDFARTEIEKVGQLLSLQKAIIPHDEFGQLKNILTKESTVVLDGYQFDTAYRTSIKNISAKLVCIEDMPNGFYPADLIICPSPLLQQSDFKALPQTVFCMGLSFALLRNAFRQELVVNDEQRSGILIAMGGTDVFGYTPTIIEQLLKCSNGLIHVIYTQGYGAEVVKELENLQHRHYDRIKLHQNLVADKVRELMDSVKQAIVSASGILVETLSRKLQIIAGYYADNQLPFYTWLVNNQLVQPLGDMRLGFDCCQTITMNTQQATNFKGFSLKTSNEWKQIIGLS